MLRFYSAAAARGPAACELRPGPGRRSCSDPPGRGRRLAASFSARCSGPAPPASERTALRFPARARRCATPPGPRLDCGGAAGLRGRGKAREELGQLAMCCFKVINRKVCPGQNLGSLSETER